MTSQILSELETDTNILFPGSADSLPAACLHSQWDGGRGLEEGGAFVRTASPSFPSRESCCVVPRVKPFCVPVSQRHSPVSGAGAGRQVLDSLQSAFSVIAF